MRSLSIAALLTGFGLLVGAIFLNKPVANASAQQDFQAPSIAIDKLITNVNNLQDQTFDTF
jgi:hypothetical protein